MLKSKLGLLPANLLRDIEDEIMRSVLVDEVASVIAEETVNENKDKFVSTNQFTVIKKERVDLTPIYESYSQLKNDIETIRQRLDEEMKRQQKQRTLEKVTLTKLNQYLDQWK